MKKDADVIPYNKIRKFKITRIYERQLSKGVCYYYQVTKEYLTYTDKVWVKADSCYLDSDENTCCEQTKGETRITLSKEGDEIYIPSERFQVKDIHAMVCQCKKCSSLWDDMFSSMSNDVKIINSNPKAKGEVLNKKQFKERMGIK